MPELIIHKGYSIERIATTLSLTTEGIFGLPLGVASTFVFIFILFGAFLDKTGIHFIIPGCQGFEVKNYDFTLDALNLKPSDVCNVGVNCPAGATFYERSLGKSVLS
jgi:hypothetical protein